MTPPRWARSSPRSDRLRPVRRPFKGTPERSGTIPSELRVGICPLPETIWSGLRSEVSAVEHDVDVCIIGTGPGGYVAAVRAAQLGLKVAVVEREELGGICLNRGCIPTKAMLRSAEVLNTTRHAADYGVLAENVSFDFGKVVDRREKVVKQLTSGVGSLMKSYG